MVKKGQKKEKGFTLIELVIVIGIIMMLSIFIIMAINPPRQLRAARDNQRKTHINAIYGAIMDYAGRNEGEFPACVTESEVDANECASDLVPDYLKEIPQDPSVDCSGSGYVVKEWPGGRVGVMASCAENEDIIRTSSWPVGHTLSMVTIGENFESGTIVASWGSVIGALSYNIKLYVNDQVIAEEETTNLSYSVDSSSFEEGDEIYIAVTAKDENSEVIGSVVSSDVIVIGSEVVYVAHTSPSSAVVGSLNYGEDISVTWDSVATAESYLVVAYVNGIQIATHTTTNTSLSFSCGGCSAGDEIYIRVRVEETDTYLASDYTQSNTVTVGKADQGAPTAPNIADAGTNYITLSSISNGEYRVNSGAWQSSTTFSGLNSSTQYVFQQRYKESLNYNVSLASANTTFSTLLACGDNLTDTRDGKVYPTIQIGGQCWVKKNMKYNDGCMSQAWNSSVDNGWCGCFNNDCNTYLESYGLLYQWSAAQNICPQGWRLATDDDFKVLELHLGMGSSEVSNSGWRASSCVGSKISTFALNGNNSSGFSAEAGGIRYSGGFDFNIRGAYWWTATSSGSSAWRRHIWDTVCGVERTLQDKSRGSSVRCVKE